MGRTMTKKKVKKEVLYLEVPADLKRRLTRLADKRVRKITAEAIMALERYVDTEENIEGIANASPGEEDQTPPDNL